MKLIATNEFDTDEVLNNLTYEQKKDRLRKLHTQDEILEILGYYDGSMDEHDMAKIDELCNDDREMDEEICEQAINNGNFQQAIAMNINLAI